MRVILADLDCNLEDLRGQRDQMADVYNPKLESIKEGLSEKG